MRDINTPSRWNMRIWDVDKNEWLCDKDPDALPYCGFDIRGGEVAAIQGMDSVYKQILHKEFIWEQSTGLKDKNSKEIYEGDIVKFKNFNNKLMVGEIKYSTEDAMFRLEYTNNSGYQDWDYVSHFNLEIIGNIHESNMEELCPKE